MDISIKRLTTADLNRQVAEIALTFARTGYAYHQIAELLNDDGWRNEDGRMITKRCVSRILINHGFRKHKFGNRTRRKARAFIEQPVESPLFEERMPNQPVLGDLSGIPFEVESVEPISYDVPSEREALARAIIDAAGVSAETKLNALRGVLK